MGWKSEEVLAIGKVEEKFPEGLDCDYVDPLLGRSLVEHLKSYWLIRQQHGYAQYYEANKVKQYLEPEKFTTKDWLCIAKVCGAKPSWAMKQLEEYEEGAA